MVTIHKKTPLILEGGGMRGVFTCGVLDFFLEQKVFFPYVIGVSAGALNGVSYISQQKGRAKKINIDLLKKYHYFALRNLITKFNIVNDELSYDLFPNKIIPFDYSSYHKNPTRFEVVTTNCITGEANYWEEKDNPKRTLDIIKSSSRLPFLSPISSIDGQPMMDGGITDSIPLDRALSLGYTNKPIVVLTRNKGYRKSKNKMKASYLFYHKYPLFCKALGNRYQMYNEQIAKIETLEEENKLIVLRPNRPLQVARTETNIQKLTELYQEGYETAKQKFEENKDSLIV